MATKLKDYDRFTQTAEGMVVHKKGGQGQKAAKKPKTSKKSGKK